MADSQSLECTGQKLLFHIFWGVEGLGRMVDFELRKNKLTRKMGKCPRKSKKYCEKPQKNEVNECNKDKDCSEQRKCCVVQCAKRCVNTDVPINDPPSFTDSSDTSIECSKNEIQLVIKRKIFGTIDIKFLRLLDPKCKPKLNESHVLITAPLIGCGTTVRHTNKAVVYSNAVTEKAQVGMVTRINKVDIPFSCYYATEGIASTLGILPRLVSKVLSGSNSSTSFILSMKLYKDNSYSEEFEAKDFPLTLGINQPLFLEVKVESPDDRLSVLTEHCYATPNQNPLDKTTYNVIQKGCPSDPTLQFYDSQHTRTRFSFNSFQFVGASQKFVFIHCKLVVCNSTDPSSRCARGCESSAQSRLRRSLNNEDYDFTQGPILVEEFVHGKTAEFSSLEPSSSLYAWLLIGLTAICLVCLTSVIFMRRKILRARENHHISSEDARETRL